MLILTTGLVTLPYLPAMLSVPVRACSSPSASVGAVSCASLSCGVSRPQGSFVLDVPEPMNFLDARRAPHASVDSMELSSLCPSLNVEPLDTHSLQGESVQSEPPRNGSVPQPCPQNGCTPSTPFLNNNFQDAFLQYNFIQKDTLQRELKRPRSRPSSPNFLMPGTAAVMGRRYLKA